MVLAAAWQLEYAWRKVTRRRLFLCSRKWVQFARLLARHQQRSRHCRGLFCAHRGRAVSFPDMTCGVGYSVALALLGVVYTYDCPQQSCLSGHLTPSPKRAASVILWSTLKCSVYGYSWTPLSGNVTYSMTSVQG